MAGAAHDPAFAKKMGIPQKVAKEFNEADAGTGIIKPKAKKKAPQQAKQAAVGPLHQRPSSRHQALDDALGKAMKSAGYDKDE